MPIFAFAQFDPENSGLTATGTAVYGADAETSLPDFLGERIIAPALGFVGILFLVLMLYAGFLWMTAGGNVELVAKAKRLIVQAVIGLVLIISAYVITTTVMNELSGITTDSVQEGTQGIPAVE